MALNTLQRAAIDSVLSFTFERIKELGYPGRSILALQAILSDVPLSAPQLAALEVWDIKEEVLEARSLLNHRDIFRYFSLGNANISGDNTTGTSDDVRAYLREEIQKQINAILELKKQEINAGFRHIGKAEELFNLSPGLSPIDFKLIETALIEPLCSKLKDAMNLEKFTEIRSKIRRSIVLTPRADAIVKLMEMSESQYQGAQRVINSLKTGHTDDDVERIFLQFLLDNPNVANLTVLANRNEVQFQTMMNRLSNRLSPAWFIASHPECRELLVSLDDKQFAQASYALKEAESDGSLRAFIDHSPVQISAIANMDDQELANFRGAINNLRVRDFAQTHPTAITSLQSMNAHQSAKAGEVLDNEWVVRLTNRDPKLLADFVNFNEAQYAQITDLIANESPVFKLLFRSSEPFQSFADMEPSRLEMIKGLLSDPRLDAFFTEHDYELQQIIEADDEEAMFGVIQGVMTANPVYCTGMIREISAEQLAQFIPVIDKAMRTNPSSCADMIRDIPADKFDKFVPTIKGVMTANPGFCHHIIKAIPADKFDKFVPTIQGVMTANPGFCTSIIIAIPKVKLAQFIPEVSVTVANLIKEGSGWIEDSSTHWNDVKKNLDCLISDQRVDIVKGVLDDISNVNRRSRLISLLTDPEKIALSVTAVKPTVWQAIHDTAKLMHGNSSEDVKNNYRTRLANEKGGDKGKGCR